MPKLTWSEPEKRLYETGVDRGVLYPVSGAGVAWNGLVSVTESPSGGGSNPFYMDGVKHVNRPESEEFGATLEAFTYPVEFEECDGTLELADGLFAGHQRRKPFGLAYRTRIGSAVDPNAGYKIHLIYNITADPTEVAHQTLSDDPNLVTFSWALTAIPKKFSGAKPTAHLVVDTTRTDAEIIAALESRLYGTSSTLPVLPEPADLIDLFTNGVPSGEFVVTDNGDGTFSITGNDVEVVDHGDGTFTLNSAGVTDNEDGTYTATSS